MAFGDLSRINTNIASMQSLLEFQKTSGEIGTRQLRLATGSRINNAGDDPSGFAIASRLESRVRGQAQALANIADAQSMLSVAEGSLGTIQDILMTMKEKVMQGANDTLASSDRTIINSTLNSLSTEIKHVLPRCGTSRLAHHCPSVLDDLLSTIFVTFVGLGSSYQRKCSSPSRSECLSTVWEFGIGLRPAENRNNPHAKANKRHKQSGRPRSRSSHCLNLDACYRRTASLYLSRS